MVTSEPNIRKASKEDAYATEYLTRETFWNLYNPGCSEHLILHQLRSSQAWIDELDLVAVSAGEIIGHIISTKAQIVNENKEAYQVLCLGPVSVREDLQRKGIGSKLINFSIEIAKQLDYPAMILFGDPAYYGRFGFVNAALYGITTKDGENFDPFMALELKSSALEQVKGKFHEDDTFAINEQALEEFEKLFPAKEKGQPRIDISHYSASE